MFVVIRDTKKSGQFQLQIRTPKPNQPKKKWKFIFSPQMGRTEWKLNCRNEVIKANNGVLRLPEHSLSHLCLSLSLCLSVYLCLHWSLFLLACGIILQPLPCLSSFLPSFPLLLSLLLFSCRYGFLHVAGQGCSQMSQAPSHTWHLWCSDWKWGSTSLLRYLCTDFQGRTLTQAKDFAWPMSPLPEQSLFLVRVAVNDQQPQMSQEEGARVHQSKGGLLLEGGE